MSNSAVNKRRLNALKNAAEALHEKDPVYKRDSDRRFIVSLIIVITLALSIRLFITEPTLVDGESKQVKTIPSGVTIDLADYAKSSEDGREFLGYAETSIKYYLDGKEYTYNEALDRFSSIGSFMKNL